MTAWFKTHPPLFFQDFSYFHSTALLLGDNFSDSLTILQALFSLLLFFILVEGAGSVTSAAPVPQLPPGTHNSNGGEPDTPSSGNPCQGNSKDGAVYFHVRSPVQIKPSAAVFGLS